MKKKNALRNQRRAKQSQIKFKKIASFQFLKGFFVRRKMVLRAWKHSS